MDIKDISLESTRDLLFKKVEEINYLNMSIEGFEYISEDNDSDLSFFAMESARNFAEANTVSIMISLADSEISTESEDGKSKVEMLKKTMEVMYKKVIASIANFIKQVQVWLSGPMVSAQSKYYEEIKEKEGFITNSFADFNAIPVVGDTSKLLKFIENLSTSGTAANETDSSEEGFNKVAVLKSLFGSFMPNVTDEDAQNTAKLIRSFLYGTADRKLESIQIKKFFADSTVGVDFISKAKAAEMQGMIKAGKKFSDSVNSMLKEAIKTSKEFNPSLAKTLQKQTGATTYTTNIIMNVLLTTFTELMFVRKMVMDACQNATKGSKTEGAKK